MGEIGPTQSADAALGGSGDRGAGRYPGARKCSGSLIHEFSISRLHIFSWLESVTPIIVRTIVVLIVELCAFKPSSPAGESVSPSTTALALG